MNLERLYTAQTAFLERYPGGFAHEDMVAVGKKHRVEQIAEQTQVLLAKRNFANLATNRAQILDSIVKTVSRSSMVSMFEKPKFRDYVNGLSKDDREALAEAFRKLLHGNQEKGFNQVLDILVAGKLAKWSLMTICSLYMRPQVDVFVKPTTTKRVISYLELEDLEYKPRPSWEFYAHYRDIINALKARLDPSLGPNNAAFTGFLMITLATND